MPAPLMESVPRQCLVKPREPVVVCSTPRSLCRLHATAQRAGLDWIVQRRCALMGARVTAAAFMARASAKLFGLVPLAASSNVPLIAALTASAKPANAFVLTAGPVLSALCSSAHRAARATACADPWLRATTCRPHSSASVTQGGTGQRARSKAARMGAPGTGTAGRWKAKGTASACATTDGAVTTAARKHAYRRAPATMRSVGEASASARRGGAASSATSSSVSGAATTVPVQWVASVSVTAVGLGRTARSRPAPAMGAGPAAHRAAIARSRSLVCSANRRNHAPVWATAPVMASATMANASAKPASPASHAKCRLVVRTRPRKRRPRPLITVSGLLAEML